jgi:acetolactate synthase-1/2/3 large subunit
MTPEPTTVALAIATYLRDQGSNAAFVVAGGASLHLIHAFANTPGCQYLPVHHEQSAAMAADGFARSSGRPGVAIATSGPGAMNLITGIAGCYYDSIPAVFVTGQVSTTRMVGSTGVRQVGFQETPIVDMVRPITKGAFAVLDKNDIRRVLEEAVWLATQGRPGPVVIDVPDDVQRQEVMWDALDTFSPPKAPPADVTHSVEALQTAIAKAQRPVIVAGAGIVLSRAEEEFVDFAERWGGPVVLTWGVPHLLPQGHPQRVGVFGTHGNRHANLILQNADLVVSVGSRLDTKATGSPVNTFARDAVKVMVDIDPAELGKFEHFGLSMDVLIESDAGDFLRATRALSFPVITPQWREFCDAAESACEPFDRSRRDGPGIDPYDFTSRLGASAPEVLDIFVDTGCALPWMMTGLVPKSGQRIMHDLNNTAMGWSLPATIGGSVASPERPNACVIGDGSLMMSMHDLVTLSAINPRARVVLVDNSGYSMIRQTQDQWLGSNYHSSSQEGGLHFPEYAQLAASTGFDFINLGPEDDIDATLQRFWSSARPVFLRVEIDPAWRVVPQVRFGRPNEDMEPLLPRDLFISMMLVEPLPQSLTADD